MMPACDHTATPPGLVGLRHLISSITGGPALRMSLRTRARMAPRQSTRAAILASISAEKEVAAIIVNLPG